MAVVGALSRNLAYLQDDRGTFSSIYDNPSITFKVFDSLFCSDHIDALSYGPNSKVEHVHLLVPCAGPCHRRNKSFSTETHTLDKLHAILRATRTYRSR